MTAPTIELAGVGPVPALPAQLHPVALAAKDTPARTWSVVACPDDGPPTLQAAGLPNSVTAGHLAQALTKVYGPDVFVVYRCPTAVTVHTAHPEHANNLRGTLNMAASAGAQTVTRWRHILMAARTTERDGLVVEAIRHAHGLSAATTAGELLLHALLNPIDEDAYVHAYAHLLGERVALHEHAVREHRAELTHRAPAAGEDEISAADVEAAKAVIRSFRRTVPAEDMLTRVRPIS